VIKVNSKEPILKRGIRKLYINNKK